MHYIRFLKPPSACHISPGSSDIRINAKVTITSDLGESFLCENVNVLATLLDVNGSSACHRFPWKAGDRDLTISFIMRGLSGPFRLVVQPDYINCRADILADVLRKVVDHEWQAGHILSVSSEPFHSQVSGSTSRRVQRLLEMHDGKDLCIWEETGESIARHIWDAGLVLSAYLEACSLSSLQPRLPRLPRLQKLLIKQKLEVLELGAGCGIVGLTVARCFPKANVLLTDLPDAQEIAMCNISAHEDRSSGGSNSKHVEYQNLNWEESRLESNRHGDLDLILVADCTYNPDVVPYLVKTLADMVRSNEHVLILLAMKIRHESERVFFDLMKEENMATVGSIVLPLPLLGQEAEEIDVYLFAGDAP